MKLSHPYPERFLEAFRKMILMLALVLVTGCGAAEPTPTPQPTPLPATPTPAEHAGILIVAMGDSLTEGLGVDTADAYPAQLERKLRAKATM